MANENHENSKLQHNSLAFVAGLKRATDEGSLSEFAQYSPHYLPLNVLLLPKDQPFIFYLLLLQLALCRVAALKKAPRTSPIVQIIFFFRSFETNKDIQSIQNTYVYKHASKQCFNCLTPFRIVSLI